MSSKTIYCDEAGFDGNNLWNPDQPHFVYAGLEIEEAEASALIHSAKEQFSIRANEIHTFKLLKRAAGQRAVSWLLEQIRGRYQVVCFHKRYSLVGKMFEYLIEPMISEGSSFFYNSGFHKFIANGIYFAAMDDPNTVGKSLQSFQALMRTGDFDELATIVETMNPGMMAKNQFLQQVATLIVCNSDAIQDELSIFDNSEGVNGVVKWILELTTTALRSMLTTFSGSEMIPLRVVCDDSKPLRAGEDFINMMVGRTDCVTVEFEGRESQMTFNLHQPVTFANSETLCAIQLADIAASSAAFALKNPNNDFSAFWHENHFSSVHSDSVFPDLEEFNLNDVRPVRNAMILHELADRSVRGVSLTADLARLADCIDSAAQGYLLSQHSD